MSFQQKYFKYKNKYLSLKNQIGGNPLEIFKILTTRSNPEFIYYRRYDGSIAAGYLQADSSILNNTIFKNEDFTTWCQSLVEGPKINEQLVTSKCNELWP